MALPTFPTTDQTLMRLQTEWVSQINPVIDSPIATPSLIQNVVLEVGDNTVTHGLGQTLQGWVITRMRGAFSQVFDKQDDNATPQTTLVLNSSVQVTVDIIVF